MTMDWKEYNEKMKFQKTRREYQNFGFVQKMLCICWLWKEQYRFGSGRFLADPNGHNVDLCTRDFQ